MAGAPHILVAVGRFYADIADQLAAGATKELEQRGASYEVVEVPGAFELPAAVAFAHQAGRFDGYVALACVIRGETSHYEHVCAESARGLADLAARRGLALGYGVLTTENRDQAWERAAVDRRNKGAEAARACLHMVELRRRFGGRA